MQLNEVKVRAKALSTTGSFNNSDAATFYKGVVCPGSTLYNMVVYGYCYALGRQLEFTD